MARARRERKRLGRRDRDTGTTFEHWSQRDLADLVSDHLIQGEKAAATSKWHPSRRGNSPHHNG